jgi:Sec-independent protein translocase protein TatA
MSLANWGFWEWFWVVVAVAVLIFVLRNLPDLFRYLRIRWM